MKEIQELLQEFLEAMPNLDEISDFSLIDIDLEVKINLSGEITYSVFARFQNDRWTNYQESIYKDSTDFEELKRVFRERVEAIKEL